VRLRSKEVLPVALLAVIVNLPGGCCAVGVPPITPVEGFNVTPEGSVGVTVKLVTVPLTVGVMAASACPAVAVTGEG
jgi:hypothetical protein